jgi:hypothetical protein
METECSLPCSQDPATGPYPEPDEPNPYSKPFSLRSIITNIFIMVLQVIVLFITVELDMRALYQQR